MVLVIVIMHTLAQNPARSKDSEKKVIMERLTCSTQIPKVGTYSQKSCWKMCFLLQLKKVSILIRALGSSQASLLLPASVRPL